MRMSGGSPQRLVSARTQAPRHAEVGSVRRYFTGRRTMSISEGLSVTTMSGRSLRY